MRKPAWDYIAIGLLAFAVRLVSTLALRTGGFFPLYLGDAASYDTWARAVAGGDWIGHAVFYQAPLYPYALGFLYATLGTDPLLVRLVQATGGAVACVLLAAAGASFFSRRAGRIAGLLLAIYPPAIFFDGIIQKTTLTALLTAGLLALLGRAHRSQRHLPLFGAGVVSGLLALTRENALILAPVLIVWAILRAPARDRWRRPIGALLVAAGLLAVLLPVALRNAAVGGVFLPTTSQLGPNFYIGNNPHADGTYAPLLAGHGDPAHERQDATALAERALGQRLSPAEVSGYWLAQGLDFIAHAPGNWLRLMARKTALALNAVELADTEDIYTYALWSPVLRGLLPLFHFGVLLPLAAFGTIVTWRRRREHGLLYALAGAYLASVILIYVFARYRFPLALILALFAGAGLAQAKAWWLEKRTVRRWLPAVGVMLAAILVANLPLVARASFRAPTLCNIAYAWIEQRNDPERARPFAERALAFEPEYANAHHLLGVLQATKGELDEAEASFRHAIAREPARALTYVQLGDVLIRRGRLPEAVAAFREATRLDPTDPATLNNLAGLLAGMQRYDEALACLQRAIALSEDSWEIRVNYALILRQSGRTAEAEALLAGLARERPDDPRAQRLIGRFP